MEIIKIPTNEHGWRTKFVYTKTDNAIEITQWNVKFKQESMRKIILHKEEVAYLETFIDVMRSTRG